MAGHPTVTLPGRDGEPNLVLSGGTLTVEKCFRSPFALREGRLDIAAATSACSSSRRPFTVQEFAVLTGTVDYTVDRINLTVTKPGVGTLVFVSNCYGPSAAPSSGVMQPMYISCRLMQEGQQSVGK